MRGFSANLKKNTTKFYRCGYNKSTILRKKRVYKWWDRLGKKL
jgi:hypothetical protein